MTNDSVETVLTDSDGIVIKYYGPAITLTPEDRAAVIVLANTLRAKHDSASS